MKQCGRCGQVKLLDLFATRTKSSDGKSNWCKVCFNQYDRERYVNGDKARKDKNRADRIEIIRSKLWKVLLESKCQECGNTDPEVLEFDHRDQTTKEFNVSEMLRSYSWSNIEVEISKCNILCANCHRKRTIKQLGFWRGRQMGVA